MKKFDKKTNKDDNPDSDEWSLIGPEDGLDYRENQGEDSSNGRNNDWNDIDDYDGYTEDGIGIKGLEGNVYDDKFYRKVEVYYVDDDTLEEIGSKSNTKKVIVKCYSVENNEKYIEIIWYSKKSK